MPVIARSARPDDDLAPLLYASARGVYDLMFGDETRALRILRALGPRAGSVVSFDACLAAERDGELVGVLAGYPLAEALARTRRFHVRAGRRAGPGRWAAMARVARAGAELTPPAPTGSWYVDALATAPWARRQGVARMLLAAAEARGRAAGCRVLALDTGLGNAAARRLYESADMTAGPPTGVGRRGRALGVPEVGFVGYVKAL